MYRRASREDFWAKNEKQGSIQEGSVSVGIWGKIIFLNNSRKGYI